MYHNAAGEIQGAHPGHPPTSPDPVRNGVIDQERPEQNEEDIRTELHPLSYGAADEGRRDDRKHTLKHDEGIGRHGPAQGIGSGAHEEDLTEVPDKSVPGGKGQGVADGNPLNPDNSQCRE